MRGQRTNSLPLTVNSRILGLLKKANKRSTISLRLKKRLQIVLLGIEGNSIYQTSKELGIRYETVEKWRSRWIACIPMLEEVSQEMPSTKGMKAHELMKLIEDVLADKHRSGSPKRISVDQEEQIRALACTSPLDHGIPMTRWTHEMLAQVAKSKKIVDQLSSRYVGTILKKMK